MRWPAKKTLLIVDHDEALGRLLQHLLARQDQDCIPVASYREALEIIQGDERSWLVLLEYGMPEANPGFLVKALRTLRPGIRIVGTCLEERREEFGEVGVDLFLKKPCRVEDLTRLVAMRN